MAGEQSERETVSIEAHQRVVTERDELKTKLGEAATALSDLTKMEKARARFLPEDIAAQLAEATAKAELVIPHLRDVELDKLDEALSQDRFKPLLASAATPPPTDGDKPEAGDEPDPGPPPPQGFGGPNPAGDDKPPEQGKISRKSPEYQSAVQRNDREQIKKWYDEGRLETPTPSF